MNVGLLIVLGILVVLGVLWLTRNKDNEKAIVQLDPVDPPAQKPEPAADPVVYPASPEYWHQIEEIGKPVEVAPEQLLVPEPVIEPVVVPEPAPKKRAKKESTAKPVVKKVVVKKVAPVKTVAAKKTAKKK